MTQYTLGFTRLLGHGRAFSELIVVPKPAAGGGFTYVTPGNYWQLFDSISFQLTTSSHTANRQVTLSLIDGSGATIVALPSASVQAASLTYTYTFSPDFSNFSTVVGTTVVSPLPTIFMQPDFKTVVTIGNVDTGDQVVNGRIYAEQLVTGDSGYLLGVVEEGSPEWDRLVEIEAVLS